MWIFQALLIILGARVGFVLGASIDKEIENLFQRVGTGGEDVWPGIMDLLGLALGALSMIFVFGLE